MWSGAVCCRCCSDSCSRLAQATRPLSAFPKKPMRIIVPFPPGAFNDTLARLLAQKFRESWGHPVVVDNRPGGATLIGGEAAAKSAPDGHTLYIVAFPFAVIPSLYTKGCRTTR